MSEFSNSAAPAKSLFSNRILARSSLANAPVRFPANRVSMFATTLSAGSLPSLVICLSEARACSSVGCAEQPTMKITETKNYNVEDKTKLRSM